MKLYIIPLFTLLTFMSCFPSFSQKSITLRKGVKINVIYDREVKLYWSLDNHNNQYIARMRTIPDKEALIITATILKSYGLEWLNLTEIHF